MTDHPQADREAFYAGWNAHLQRLIDRGKAAEAGSGWRLLSVMIVPFPASIFAIFMGSPGTSMQSNGWLKLLLAAGVLCVPLFALLWRKADRVSERAWAEFHAKWGEVEKELGRLQRIKDFEDENL